MSNQIDTTYMKSIGQIIVCSKAAERPLYIGLNIVERMLVKLSQQARFWPKNKYSLYCCYFWVDTVYSLMAAFRPFLKSHPSQQLLLYFILSAYRGHGVIVGFIKVGYKKLFLLVSQLFSVIPFFQCFLCIFYLQMFYRFCVVVKTW